MPRELIYADNAATTKMSDVAFAKMLPFLQEQYGNASSQYSLAMKSKRAIEQAREQVAVGIGAERNNIIFTSGGSESNSWVLSSVPVLFGNKGTHIITSGIEHHSVLRACHALEQKGIDVTYLSVDRVGRVTLDNLKAAIRPDTKFVSLMLANNEIGTIQPIAEIGRYLRDKNILFHTDAVQAMGHIPVNVNELYVDFLAASAHKFNGAKGTGILYKRSGISVPQIVFGGEQEYGLRSGTENVAGIVAAGYALEENISDMRGTANRLVTFVQATIDGIRAKVPNICVNGDPENRLPGIVNIAFENSSGESLMHLLDLKGICVSTSSACTSGKDEPSHVLMALGLSEKQAKSAIRISYGKYNTMQEVESVIFAVCNAYDKIFRATSNL
ncbi:cysteine desulfurase [Acididesulfobacillus acetoxydans]|uniref:cysteine desulfurase n=1 Tax=Acididesulfobacillus acetoxydans TaxID=1561005 RepID=A0A8S0X786_9FIRM|nr:cysteine desulfurase family protein [Acididesulfobacillus acetoxydans]CAA7603110.1 cysteine desulfurase [Acididesulfobacillus acetoxydans]CEJ05652.1 Cysteine desulfurase [Acididesulfobacillus acetoxydans]